MAGSAPPSRAARTEASPRAKAEPSLHPLIIIIIVVVVVAVVAVGRVRG
jgi:hypothetical protein